MIRRGGTAVVAFALAMLTTFTGPSANEPHVDTSSPEATISTYYRGYTLGNRAMIQATFLTPHSIESVGLGDAVQYQIVNLRKVTKPALSIVRSGDVELEVLSESRAADGKRFKHITTFFLRQIDVGWRIVGYASEPAE